MVKTIIEHLKKIGLKEIFGLKPVPYTQTRCEHFDFDKFKSHLEPLSSPAFYPTLCIECPNCKRRGRLTCYKNINNHTMIEKKLVWQKI